jgi:two-component system, OmpR family, sensor kinase
MPLDTRLPLRWRLTGWVACLMIVAVAAIFLVVYEDTGSHLGTQINRDITVESSQLSQSVRAFHGHTPRAIATAAESYLAEDPYSATATLLFVLTPGAPAASNHPELFKTPAPESGESPAVQATEAAEARALTVPHLGYSTRIVPDVGRVRILERRARVGHIAVVVAAGEPLVTVERAQHAIAAVFLLASAVTIALAVFAAYFAGRRVSAPLRRLTAVAKRIDAGELEPRVELSQGTGGEVRVLAEAFNHMLDRLAEAFASQREFVADASHELRTPLTVIRGQLEVLEAQRNPPEAEVRRIERLVQAEVSRISRLVDDLLVLAQAEEPDFVRAQDIDVRPFITELWDGISLVAERQYELGPIPDGTLRADPDRLAQALRNVARNAIEHTSPTAGLVRLEVAGAPHGRLAFEVIDDGPGITPAERERIFERFHRTDRARARSAGGAGLGLAIVRAIATAHDGEVHAADPAGGAGARIELVLPGFVPALTPTVAATR